MTIEEIELLLSSSVRSAVRDNIDRDPLWIAMQRTIEHPRLVASQVKYLQRAKTKLPSYYAAQCLLTGRGYEQSSSEASASNRGFKGELCIDLTAGLGVDTLHLSRGFKRVISVERDAVMARLLEVNMELLGVRNVEVLNMSAEQFLAQNSDLRADIIFIDPDRRGVAGEKLVALAGLSPNVVELLPELRGIADRVVVKLSPLFDIDEAFRVFGEGIRVEVVSLKGECKEVVVEVGGSGESTVSALVLERGVVEYPYEKGGSDGAKRQGDVAMFKYITLPDVALAKGGIAVRYFEQLGAYIESDNSFAFSTEPILTPLGRLYEIEQMVRYSPRRLKRELKAKGIKRIDILRRNFPLSGSQIASQLSISEGGAVTIGFTELRGELWVLLLK